MKRIVLSADEIKVIHQQLNGEIEVWWATDEQQRLLMGVIDQANSLLAELNAYEELENEGGDLIAWFYRKYQEQPDED